MVSLLLIVPEQTQGSVALYDREFYFVQTACALLARGRHQILVDHSESVKNITPDLSVFENDDRCAIDDFTKACADLLKS